METTQQAFSYGDIAYTLPITLQSLTGLTMIQNIGEHVELTITGIAADTLEPQDIERVLPKAPMELTLPGKSQPYFAGVCTSITMKYQAGLKTLEIKGRSWTHELDITKKCRSYQRINISYQTLVADILKDSPQAQYLIELPDNKQYATFAVQYWETDWEFLKRLAAREGTVLVAEYGDSQHNPRFWFGLPTSAANRLPATAQRTTQRDLEKYLAATSNRSGDFVEDDFMTYEDSSYEILPLGERVIYKGKELRIIKISSNIEKSLLRNTYTLAYSEKIALGKTENDNLRSVALTGKVLASSNIHSKIHLAIDQEQDPEGARWFPYASPTNNFLYCMPHTGEDINLYFRDGKEENAIAISGARKNGGGCQKTADYCNRYFSNHQGKELFLSPDTLSYTVDEKATDKISIKMIESAGIFIESKKHIGIGADRNVILVAEKDIVLEGMMGTYVICGDGNITLKTEADIFGPAKVTLDGSSKSAFSPLETAEEETGEDLETSIDNFMDDHPLVTTILSLTPVVSSAIDAYDAYKAFKKGDVKGGLLSLGSAIIGLIPGGKLVSTGAKVAKNVVEGGIALGSYAHAKNVF